MAKKFNFKLEPVLRLRNHKVKQAEEDLMKVVNARLQKESKIAELKLYHNKLMNSKNRACSAADIQAECHHKESVKEEIKKLEKEIVQILEIEKIKRKKLTEAMKEEKTIEKLKERKFENYKQEMNREEINELNEIAVNRHVKKVESETP